MTSFCPFKQKLFTQRTALMEPPPALPPNTPPPGAELQRYLGTVVRETAAAAATAKAAAVALRNVANEAAALVLMPDAQPPVPGLMPVPPNIRLDYLVGMAVAALQSAEQAQQVAIDARETADAALVVPMAPAGTRYQWPVLNLQPLPQYPLQAPPRRLPRAVQRPPQEQAFSEFTRRIEKALTDLISRDDGSH